jgi:putative peptidoglycan lipid II flippase
MLKSSIFVSVLSLVGSVISFINQVLLAIFFGAGISMDIYLSASSIPILVSGLINAALSYSLTPQLVKFKLEAGDKYALFAANIFRKVALISAAICLVGAMVMGLTLKYIFPVTAAHLHAAILVNSISWLGAFLTIILGMASSYLNANKNFIKPLLLTYLPYACTIIACLLFYKQISVVSIPAGLAIGTLISLSLCYKDVFAKLIFRNTISADFSKVNIYIRTIPVAAIAMICFTIYQSIDAYWAPKLGSANLSYLGYCQRLLIAVGALVITGPSTVLIPRLAQAVAENRKNDFLCDAVTVIKLIIALSSVMAVIGSILAEPIIEVMFERGAFSHNDTLGIASLLPYMLTGMVFMLCVVMLFRVLFVREMSVKVSFLGICCAALYFIFSGLGVKYVGIQGIGLAYIFTWICIFSGCIYYLFKDDVQIIFCRNSLVFCIKQILLLSCTAFIVVFIRNKISGYSAELSFYQSVLSVLVCGSLGMIVYFVLSVFVFKQMEIILLLNPIIKKANLYHA